MDEEPQSSKSNPRKTKKPSVSSKKTILSDTSQDLVILLYKYFKCENENGGPLRSLAQVQARVSDAFGISRTTVSRIMKEKYGGPYNDLFEEMKLTTPVITRKRAYPVTDVDEYTAEKIRNHVEQYKERGETPTIAKLVDSLNEENLFDGERTSLRRVLKNIGFKYVPNGVGQPILTYVPKSNK